MIIDGKSLSKEIQREIARFTSSLTDRRPCLAVILVGNDPASEIYVNTKTKTCAKTGILSVKDNLPSHVSEEILLQKIDELNRNPLIDGILVQAPLPSHINTNKINFAISPEKDVDGFHPVNLGKLMLNDDSGFIPCTPLGIRVMLAKNNISVKGKHVVIVGRSVIVGKPMASLLLQKGEGGDATVTVVHKHTPDLEQICREADILISATGMPGFIKGSMVKQGAVVIDVGINRVPCPDDVRGYKIVGDVDFDAVKEKCSLITPVPGGVGPMTIAMLLNNTVKSFTRRRPDLCKNTFSCY